MVPFAGWEDEKKAAFLRWGTPLLSSMPLGVKKRGLFLVFNFRVVK